MQAKNRIKGWLDQPRKTGEEIIEKYGEPDEATESMLVWHNNGPWKRTVLRNEEIRHDFPKPHKDCLEQTINYRVPPELFDDLARFDGSVIVERTKGEISARCDAEAANFLAINLANDIVNGDIDIDEARERYTEAMVKHMMGKDDPYVTALQFMPETDTADPDEQTVTDALKERIKEGMRGAGEMAA